MKDGLRPNEDFDPSDYPGLKKLTDPDVYVVVANTPGEFVALVQRLQARTDLRWVEPIIEYGEVAPNIRTTAWPSSLSHLQLRKQERRGLCRPRRYGRSARFDRLNLSHRAPQSASKQHDSQDRQPDIRCRQTREKPSSNCSGDWMRKAITLSIVDHGERGGR